MSFQPGQMIRPFFVALGCYFRKAKLVKDVSIVVGKRASKKPFDVFKNKSLGLRLSHGPNSLGKHVSIIGMTEMFASDRKRLARWSPTHKINLSLMRPKIIMADIALNDVPVLRVFHPRSLITPQRLACIVIPIKHHDMLKSCSGSS